MYIFLLYSNFEIQAVLDFPLFLTSISLNRWPHILSSRLPVDTMSYFPMLIEIDFVTVITSYSAFAPLQVINRYTAYK